MLEILPERLAAESEQQRQQVIDLLLPYIILPFRVRSFIQSSLTTSDILLLLFYPVPIGPRTG
jgi:hypothetical protein